MKNFNRLPSILFFYSNIQILLIFFFFFYNILLKIILPKFFIYDERIYIYKIILKEKKRNDQCDLLFEQINQNNSQKWKIKDTCIE